MPHLTRKKLDGSVIESITLTEKALVFGRAKTADIPVTDERISRQHFAIGPKDDGYIIHDLQSTNGTWVNGDRIQEAALKNNDRIRAGQTVWVFEAS